MALAGTKTHDNLKEAFAGESQANRRYLYFAQKADIEGYNDVFRYNAKDWFRPPEWYCDAIESVGLVAQNATDKMVAGAGSQNVGHPIGSKGMKFSSHLVAATLK